MTENLDLHFRMPLHSPVVVSVLYVPFLRYCRILSMYTNPSRLKQLF